MLPRSISLHSQIADELEAALIFPVTLKFVEAYGDPIIYPGCSPT